MAASASPTRRRWPRSATTTWPSSRASPATRRSTTSARTAPTSRSRSARCWRRVERRDHPQRRRLVRPARRHHVPRYLLVGADRDPEGAWRGRRLHRYRAAAQSRAGHAGARGRRGPRGGGSGRPTADDRGRGRRASPGHAGPARRGRQQFVTVLNNLQLAQQKGRHSRTARRSWSIRPRSGRRPASTSSASWPRASIPCS